MSEAKPPTLTLVETSHAAITSLIDHYTLAMREQEHTHAIERAIQRAKDEARRTRARSALKFASESNTPDLVIEEFRKLAEGIERGD